MPESLPRPFDLSLATRFTPDRLNVAQDLVRVDFEDAGHVQVQLLGGE